MAAAKKTAESNSDQPAKTRRVKTEAEKIEELEQKLRDVRQKAHDRSAKAAEQASEKRDKLVEKRDKLSVEIAELTSVIEKHEAGPTPGDPTVQASDRANADEVLAGGLEDDES